MASINMIAQTLGAGSGFRSFDDILNSHHNTKEFNILKQIVERYQRGNLPYINEDSIVEFPQSGMVGGGHKPLSS